MLGAAFNIPLTDADLAKLGLLAVLESKAKFMLLATLKTVAGYSHEQFLASDRLQLGQITERLLLLTAGVNSELHHAVEEFERLRIANHEIRHKYIHALWGFGEGGKGAVARDIRRQETLKPEDLDQAIVSVAELARQAQVCAGRVIDLIYCGVLQEGKEPSPAMYNGGRWIRF